MTPTPEPGAQPRQVCTCLTADGLCLRYQDKRSAVTIRDCSALTKDMIVNGLIALALFSGTVLGSRARAKQISGDTALKPTWFAHGLTFLILSFLTFIVVVGSRETRTDQLLYVYGLLVAFGFGLLFWIWYFYARVVYWNVNGIGIRGLAPQRFIQWQSVDWAGRTWDGSFLVSSGKTKVRYSQFDGGHEQLNSLIMGKLPQFIGKF
jgi:hypothetical protein